MNTCSSDGQVDINHYEATMTEQYKQMKDGHSCSLGHHMHHNTMFGQAAMKAAGISDEEMTEYIKSSLYYLALHEVGHTLGLMHNMKSSQLHSPEALKNNQLTASQGVTGSVMDYPSANLDPEGKAKVQNFTRRPGPYDEWAITYGYSTADADPLKEEARLKTILSRSAEPALTFGNDADDMRYPGKGIDPRVMIGDLSSDAIKYASGEMKLSDKLLKEIKEKYTTEGQSYHELRNAYFILTGQQARAAGVVSRYIGGVYVERAHAGQTGETQPFTPVSYKDQKRAMKVLSDQVFAPGSFAAPEGLYNYLQMQRRGFNFFGNDEDPKITDRARMTQLGVLVHLLHPNTTHRINNSELYGNKYKLGEMMTDLTDAIFKADIKKGVDVFRSDLQSDYVTMLIAMSTNKKGNRYDNATRAQAFYQLQQIDKMLKTSQTSDVQTKAHRALLKHRIDEAMDTRG